MKNRIFMSKESVALSINVMAVLALLFLPLLSTPSSAGGGPPLTYFTDNVESTGTTTTITEMEQALLDLINDANVVIDVAIYDFNRESIRDALIAAHNRGVFVRVVTDDEASEHNATYKPFYDALKNAGIGVVDDNRPADIMHNKFIVVDGRYVWSGSTNLSDNGFTKNHNNSVLFDSTDIAATFISQFNQMYVDGNFSRAKVPSLTTQFTYNGIPVEVYFSPEDEAMAEMIEEVDSATESIYFSIFFLTNDSLRDALINAHNRGVKIRGIWDLLGASGSFSDDEALCEAGIPIKIENYIGKMHNKLMILDVNGDSPRVITGSMNWSNAGDQDNDENTIIIHDATTATAFKSFWDEMYNGLDDSTLCIPEPDISTVYLPVLFNNSELQVTPPPEPEADVRIISVTYNPDGADLDGEVVVLENLGNAAEELTGWTLFDEANTIFSFPSFILEAGASVSVWVMGGVDDATNLYWGRGSAVWNNSGDTATLHNGLGEGVDSCTYDGGEIGEVCYQP